MILILEGPDGQGKTTLASALIGMLDSHGVEWEYHKSPAGRSTDWDPAWSVWVKLHEKTYHDTSGKRFVILDRVPEISEPIYAFANGRPSRYNYPIRGWAEWNTRAVFPIFAVARAGLRGRHIDPWGKRISKDRQESIHALYEYTGWLFQFFMPHTFFWDFHHQQHAFFSLTRAIASKNAWFPPPTQAFDFDKLVEEGRGRVSW